MICDSPQNTIFSERSFIRANAQESTVVSIGLITLLTDPKDALSWGHESFAGIGRLDWLLQFRRLECYNVLSL